MIVSLASVALAALGIGILWWGTKPEYDKELVE